MVDVVLKDDVSSFLTPSVRSLSYRSVVPKKLAALLEKLARYGLNTRIRAENEKGEKRRLESQAVARMPA